MERGFEFIDLDYSQIESICYPYFKKGHLKAFQSLSGGAINTTYKIIWDERPFIVRLYVRDLELAQIEEAVYRLIHNKVAMPDLLHIGRFSSYPFAIFEFVDKKHIFEISNQSLASTLSYDLGKVLAGIHSFHFPHAGLFGKNFVIHTPFEEGSSPYFAYIMEHFSESSLVWQRLGNERASRLKDFLNDNQGFFPVVSQGGVLVHSDFKPVNLLWDEDSGLTVLDWEFAHIGNPLIDFAILLRHFQDFPLNINSLEKGYSEHGGIFVDDWIRKARLADVINVVQLLNTPVERPQLFKFLLQSINFTIFRWSSLDEELREVCQN